MVNQLLWCYVTIYSFSIDTLFWTDDSLPYKYNRLSQNFVVHLSIRVRLCNPRDCNTPAFLSFPISTSLHKLISIESVMPSNDLILMMPHSPQPSTFAIGFIKMDLYQQPPIILTSGARFVEDNVFTNQGRGMVTGWLKHHIFCALYFYLYYISSTSYHQA